MHKVERTLRREATGTPYGYDKQEVEDHLQNVRQIVGALHTLNPFFDEDPGMDEYAPHLTSVSLRNSTTISPLESGMSPSSALSRPVWNFDHFLSISTMQPMDI